MWVTPKGETSEREDKEVEDRPPGWSHSKVRGRREGRRGKPGDAETGTRGGGGGSEKEGKSVTPNVAERSRKGG